MKLLTATSVALFVFLQLALWFGNGGILEVWRLQDALLQQRMENETLKKRNLLLAAEVQDLKVGMAAVEERARHDLGMIKDGEIFFQVIPQRKG